MTGPGAFLIAVTAALIWWSLRVTRYDDDT